MDAGSDTGSTAATDAGVTAAELVAAVRPLLPKALIATDFDGTLAPLQPDPDDSRPVAGAIEALAALAAQGAQIAVITGRDARTVVRLGGLDAVPGLVVAGLYGIEVWRDGELTSPGTPQEIEALRTRLPDALRDADPAVWIEDKRLSLVVHARRAADPDAALAQLAPAVSELGHELGFEVHPGSGVLELRLPGHDKGGALERLAGGRDAVVFLGDDIGDLPAMQRARQLRAQGRAAYAVGVLSSRVAEVPAAADVTVPDPDAAVALLRALAG